MVPPREAYITWHLTAQRNSSPMTYVHRRACLSEHLSYAGESGERSGQQLQIAQESPNVPFDHHISPRVPNLFTVLCEAMSVEQ